jgi:hypothetical protein
MFKMGLYHPFEYLKHKLWLKERLGVKVPIWLPTTKSWESPRFIYVQMTCHILLKKSQQWLQLCFRPHFNRRFAQEIISLQSVKSCNFRNFGTPNLGVSGQNDIWVQPPWLITYNTIRGKVVASLKSKPWWVLWVRVCSWSFVHQKWSNYALTNLLFGLCRSVLIVDPLFTCPSPPSQSSNTPFLPPKCWELRNVFQFLLQLFSPLDLHLSLSRNLGVHHLESNRWASNWIMES